MRKLKGYIQTAMGVSLLLAEHTVTSTIWDHYSIVSMEMHSRPHYLLPETTSHILYYFSKRQTGKHSAFLHLPNALPFQRQTKIYSNIQQVY